jgi:ribosomal protein S12 methylthiotransferase
MRSAGSGESGSQSVESCTGRTRTCVKTIMKKNQTVCLVNLGCHKNQVDAELILGELDNAGYSINSNPDRADIIIVNTCSFLNAAREESVDVIREMLEYKKTGRLKQLVVAGCMADRDRLYLMPVKNGIDQFLSPFQIGKTTQILQPDQPVQPPVSPGGRCRRQAGIRLMTTPRSFGFLKIADGCDNRCAYCRIPYLRGAFRSRPPEDIIRETMGLIESGRREIVMISQDSTSYGKDNPQYGNLQELLQKLVRLAGLKWLRLMYLYPSGLDEDFLRFVADNPFICRYLDIPLQHTNPRILKKMNRRIPGLPGQASPATGDFLDRIRSLVPGITIRSTLMTGYPGEDEKVFREMLSLVEAGAFDHLGVFSWSCEPDTVAMRYRADAVDRDIAEERTAMLMQAQAEVVDARSRSRLNRICEVVVDGPDEDDEGSVIGRTEFQAPEVDGWVRLRGNYESGSWLQVRLIEAELYDFNGIIDDIRKDEKSESRCRLKTKKKRGLDRKVTD